MADTRTLPAHTPGPADTPGANGPGRTFPLAIALAMAVAGFLCGYGTGSIPGIPDQAMEEFGPGQGMVAALPLLGGLIGAFGIGWVSGRMAGRVPGVRGRGPAVDGCLPGHRANEGRADDGEVAAGGGATAPCLSGPAAPWGRAGSGIPAVALGGSGLSLPPRP
ncbi:hypothetical protein MVG78_00875 [Roseomonas gilardii subsp. gilardii]|uniref:hypothetical protein n=1 Tax=Roseomonas gilardii TaxID=257708 RepID=UPI001FF914A3|nr:hypothetical protein [Roseomonas gilardii]UPG72789.1 hypothetical protein MVG78_00875 [Roseomonas gilardii subsp. gilardii]